MLRPVFFSALLIFISSQNSQPTLVDHHIAAGSLPVFLDGAGWTVTSSNQDFSIIPASVPGDILTDLQRAEEVNDPYWNLTWLQPAFIDVWNKGTWTYTRKFKRPPTASGSDTSFLLVFDGIRMGAMIALNGKPLGNATNQFQRYVYHLSAAHLHDGTELNVLTVTFGEELLINTGGRFTISTSYDWSPRQNTRTPFFPNCPPHGVCNRSTFGFGIWKSVYLVPLGKGEAAITQLVPHTFYAGGHPTTLLSDDSHAGFSIDVQLEIFSASRCFGTVSVHGSWPLAQAVSKQVSLEAGINSISLHLAPEQTLGAKLWNPRGHGSQNRYNISATFLSAAVPAAKPATTTRMIGFRHIALVTVNDTNTSTVWNTRGGTGQFTMFYRVNGAPLYARGGNKIPMDLMEGRMTANAFHRLVQSAAEANFNMLRVWGGGIWEPRAFFDAADQFGVLVNVDMQFDHAQATGATYEHLEIDYQVKRLSHHPSIATWNGCNECHDFPIYQTFVMPSVAAADKSRAIRASCPSAGWVSGVDSLSSRPNNDTLRAGAGSASGKRSSTLPFPQESHGPYTGMMIPKRQGFISDATMPSAKPLNKTTVGAEYDVPSAVPAWTGPAEEGWYKSEFGGNSWSSFESMSAVLPPDQWSMSSVAAKERNWNVSNIITTYFGTSASVVDLGELAFKRQLYQSMIGQMIFLKTLIESWRSQNNWGSTIWMYNEIWPTGGWGSIEYGSPVPGQVEGGRWKPLQYSFRSSTYADQLCTCNTDGACFATNDSPFSFDGTVSLRLLNVMSGRSMYVLKKKTLHMPAGAGVVEWFCAESPLTKSQTYNKHACQIPNTTYTRHLALDEFECESKCNSDRSCIGFTMYNVEKPMSCWLYETAPGLESRMDADWYQKPGTKTIPALPSLCKSPPAELSCTDWTATPAWRDVHCEVNGTNCVLLVEVANVNGTEVSKNTLPFRPPKAMKFPKAVVTAAFGEIVDDQIAISLTTNATALYTVLTTRAQGRFSDNAFLLESGNQRTVYFQSWAALDDASIASMKSSFRIEHLSDYLDSRDKDGDSVVVV